MRLSVKHSNLTFVFFLSISWSYNVPVSFGRRLCLVASLPKAAVASDRDGSVSHLQRRISWDEECLVAPNRKEGSLHEVPLVNYWRSVLNRIRYCPEHSDQRAHSTMHPLASRPIHPSSPRDLGLLIVCSCINPWRFHPFDDCEDVAIRLHLLDSRKSKRQLQSFYRWSFFLKKSIDGEAPHHRQIRR